MEKWSNAMIMTADKTPDNEFELLKRFNERFGPGAERVALEHIHGHEKAPLAGMIGQPGDYMLLHIFMEKALEIAANQRQHEFNDFLDEMRKRHKENPGETPSINDEFADMIEETLEQALKVLHKQCPSIE